MNNPSFIALALACAAIAALSPARGRADAVHTPKPRSAEERAILNALAGSPIHRFKIHYLKVHNGWLWADVTPLDAKGAPVAEGGTQLLRRQAGAWKSIDLARVPEDPNDPMASQDASAVFVRHLRKKYPSIPKDIFPKSAH